MNWTEISSIRGWLTRREGKFLYRLAGNVPDNGVIVEIGSYEGRSTVCLAKGIKHNAKVYSIDPHTRWCRRYNEIGTGERFLSNMRNSGVGDRVVPIFDYSYNAARKWYRHINLLFIDGSHDEDSVTRDFKLFFPFVAYGGWIVLHDTTSSLLHRLPGYAGPRRAADKLMFLASSVGRIVTVDTITAGQKEFNVGPETRMRNLHVRLRKVPSDLLSVLLNMVMRLANIGQGGSDE